MWGCPRWQVVSLALALLASRAASAQGGPRPEKEKAAAPEAEVGVASLDPGEVVLAATKIVASLAETPAIVTVVTDDEIRARGYRTVEDVLASLPGFEARAEEWFYSDVFTRGNARTTLVLWNGVPVGSPAWPTRELNRLIPVEFIKRIEVVTGPGGVLWGANAFLGIVNITTRDGESSRGIEFRAGGGTGPAAPGAARSTISFGERFFNKRLKVFVGLNFATDGGPQLRPPLQLYISGYPPPSADGPSIIGLWGRDSPTRRNWLLIATGNARLGPVTFDLYYPVLNRSYQAYNLLGARTDAGLDANRNVLRGAFSDWRDDFFVTSLTYRQRLAQRLAVVARGYFVGAEDITGLFGALPPGLVAETPRGDSVYFTCPNPCTQTAVQDAFAPGHADPRWGRYRAGGSVDAEIDLWSKNKLLVGIE
ncbi:MAG: TonB-dependent receptor plug domain-containing protein, partial [Deltaproteobacteria bacterium]|nr:TonB-dependent receptor plug domain-containing protein [Deltaproteobacteria bacterium]